TAPTPATAPTPPTPPLPAPPPTPTPTPTAPPVTASPPAPAPTPVVPPPAAAQGSANLLFRSGFDSSTALNTPSGFFTTGGWQDIVGVDSTTGSAWSINIWGGSATRFQMIIATPVADATTLGNYQVN